MRRIARLFLWAVMATHDVTIFNAHADEGGEDTRAFIIGTKANAFASAPTANQQSNNATVSATGAEAPAQATAASGGLDSPAPNQPKYFQGISTTADLAWRSVDDIVQGWDHSFPPTHTAKFAGIFQNPNKEGVPSYWTGPRLRRVNIKWRDIEAVKGQYNWQPLHNALNNLPSQFVGIHLNIRGNAVYVVGNQGTVANEQVTTPDWLRDQISPGYNPNNPPNTNIIRETSGNRIIDNVDLRVNAVTNGWLDLIQSFEDEGFPSHPKIHNQLLHAVSSSLGEEATGSQWNIQAVQDQYLPVIERWVTAYKNAGTEKKLMWLKWDPSEYATATVDQGCGIRGGGAIERWLADKYSPGFQSENGLSAEIYESGDFGSYYLTVDNNFIITSDDRAWQDQPEVVDTSNPTYQFHYRMSILRCAQLGFDNVFTYNEAGWDPRIDHWLSYQLAQNVDDPSAEAFCALGEWWHRGGAQITPFGNWRLRNIEKWLYQREYHGSTTRTTLRQYDRNSAVISGSLDPPADLEGWFSRRGSSIGFALDDSFISGATPVIIKITYIDQGFKTFTLSYNEDTKSRSVSTEDSADTRTVTFFIDDFVKTQTGLNPDFYINSNGTIDFQYVRVIKWQ